MASFLTNIHEEIGEILAKRRCEIKLRVDEPQREGRYLPVPRILNQKLVAETKKRFPQGLYSHQAIAVTKSVLQKKHIAMTTSTASGKSLGFILPAFHALLSSSQASVLYVFPIKALANDQMRKLESWANALGLKGTVQRVDGSVTGEIRKEALFRARLLVTTPDVLHTSLLRESRVAPLNSFFANLQYVILDECHEYDGVFGSHASYVFRRLRQLCRDFGADPRFIMASATVGNPEMLLQSLTSIKPVHVIGEAENGSPKAEKSIWLSDPGEAGENPRLISGLIADLVRLDRKFIVFCNSRLTVERTVAQLRSFYPGVSQRVRSYRAGYLSEERQQIENELHEGKISGVIATAALEMGIDLPDLDVCLMIGFPDSRISLLQRMGRVGRCRSGAVILLAGRTAHDAFYSRRPDLYFATALKKSVINLENREIILSHFACARAEAADFSAPEFNVDIFGEAFCQVANQLNLFECAAEILHEREPHFKVQIRAIDDPSYKLLLGYDKKAADIGTITYSQVLREAVPEGVYIHQGRHYRVSKVSHGDHVVFLDSRCYQQADTVPRIERFVRERSVKQDFVRRCWNGLEVRQASLGILEKVIGFTERGSSVKKTVEYKQPLLRYFATTGLVIVINDLGEITPPGLYGAATAIFRAFPIVTGNAKSDVAVHAYRSPDGQARIFIYDNVSGGLRLAEQAIVKFAEILNVAIEHVASCTYCDDPDNGCVLCVIDEHWSGYEPIKARLYALKLLRQLLRTISEPETHRASEIAPINRSSAPLGVFGRTMIMEGATVFTRDNKEGVVIRSTACFDSLNGGQHERIYSIQCAGRERSYLGYALKLVTGKVEQWCISCGQEGIDMDLTECPNCHARLTVLDSLKGVSAD